MDNVIRYAISNNRLISQIFKDICNTADLVPAGRETGQFSYYDSFDWRLYKSGYHLTRKKNLLQLHRSDNEKTVAEAELENQNRSFFWYDISQGNLSNIIKKLLGVRALINLAKVQITRKKYRILNDNKKTIARLESSVYKNVKTKTTMANFLILDVLRGYKDEARHILTLIDKDDVQYIERPILVQTLEFLGKNPGEYSSKPGIELQPDMPAAHAVGRILEHLFDIMQKNCDGIIADIDTEFLHDFRVAVRRARSLVGQIKNVFPADMTEWLKTDLAFLGKSTNRLRDMDVYLLKKEQYFSRLPDDLWDGLAPFFEHISSERNKEKQKIEHVLTDRNTQNKMDYWKQKFSKPVGTNAATAANQPVYTAARKKILKKYRQVLRLGDQIDDRTPDAQLHDLRIACKKLRYLLEFFQSLFPRKKIGRFIKKVKLLQENLGDFNDFYVQQLKLREYLDNISESHAQYVRISAAIGGLITHLHQQQIEARSHFSKTWQRFKKTDFQALFKKPNY